MGINLIPGQDFIERHLSERLLYSFIKSGYVSIEDAKNIENMTMDEGIEFLENKLFPTITFFYEA